MNAVMTDTFPRSLPPWAEAPDGRGARQTGAGLAQGSAPRRPAPVPVPAQSRARPRGMWASVSVCVSGAVPAGRRAVLSSEARTNSVTRPRPRTCGAPSSPRPPSRAAAPLPCRARGGGRGEAEAEAEAEASLDVAVLQFTLGSWTDDEFLAPAFLGVAGAAVLVASHMAGEPVVGGAARAALAASEAQAAILCAALVATSVLGRPLAQLAGARGRLGRIQSAGGSFVPLVLDDTLPEPAQAELAWATYALYTQTDSTGVSVWDRGGTRLLCCRGVTAFQPPQAPWIDSGQQAAQYLADKAAVARWGREAWPLPAGTLCALAIPLRFPGGNDGVLLLTSDGGERMYPAKERLWARALADKLEATV